MLRSAVSSPPFSFSRISLLRPKVKHHGNSIPRLVHKDGHHAVGPGTVLHDLIESGVIPVVQLTEVFRQGGGQPNHHQRPPD
jgi:hypothetical protein